jgi:hypothetical protein
MGIPHAQPKERFRYQTVACEIATPVVPGTTYGLSSPLRIRVGEQVGEASFSYWVHEMLPPGLERGTQGTSGALRLVPKPGGPSTGPDIRSNTDELRATTLDTGQRPALTADGAATHVAVGEPFDVEVGVRNDGRAR